MPRKNQTPRTVQKSPPPYSNDPHGTVREWLRRNALQGTWADVCALIFLEWYPIWKQRPHAQDLNWTQFRRQVQEGARQFWFSDPTRVGRKGRRSVGEQCFQAIEAYMSRQRVRLPNDYPDPTQGALIRAIKHCFPKLEEPTCRKYARLWQLLYRKSPREYTGSDWKFLQQHLPEDAAGRRFALLSRKDRSKAIKEMAQDLAKNNLLF